MSSCCPWDSGDSRDIGSGWSWSGREGEYGGGGRERGNSYILQDLKKSLGDASAMWSERDRGAAALVHMLCMELILLCDSLCYFSGLSCKSCEWVEKNLELHICSKF